MSMTADNKLWLAYADLIRRQLQVTDLGPKDVILPYPVTKRGPAAGNAIPSPVTNFLVFNLADNLRPADSLDSKTAGSYSRALLQYLNWVEPAPPPTREKLQRLEEANKILDLAEKNFRKADDGVFESYKKAKKRDSNILRYHAWVVENAKDLIQMKQKVQDAVYEVGTARTNCYGPYASQLNEYLTALEVATSRTIKADSTSLNMSADRDSRSKFEDAGTPGGVVSSGDVEVAMKASTRVPLYQIDHLLNTMNDWIRQKSGPRGEWLKLDLSVGEMKTWKDFGFTHSSVSGSTSWFPFFSAVVERDYTTRTEHLNIENEESNIMIEVSFQQITALDIRRGLWDVTNVKARFPILRKDAPSILSDTVVVNKVLFAYDVALRVTFKGSLKQQAHDLLEEAKKAGTGLWIFGFHVGGKSEKYVKSDFDCVKWDEASNSILLEPARDAAYPTLLGLLGHRL